MEMGGKPFVYITKGFKPRKWEEGLLDVEGNIN